MHVAERDFGRPHGLRVWLATGDLELDLAASAIGAIRRADSATEFVDAQRGLRLFSGVLQGSLLDGLLEFVQASISGMIPLPPGISGTGRPARSGSVV